MQSAPLLEAKSLKYRWIADWAKIPETNGHSHHGIVVMRDGNILTGHALEAKVCVLSPQGDLIREVAVPVNETHGLALAEENGTEVLWIADVGGKDRDHGGPQVVKVDLTTGKRLARLTKADFPGYGEKDNWCPTAVAIDPANGDVWVTDGYGSSKTHRFSKELQHQLTIDGTDGLGRFSCPHWVFVDRRKGMSEIYIADRSNNRVQVYGPEGRFLRGIAEGLTTPSVFASFGEYLVIGELKARLVILDGKDQIVGYLGAGLEHVAKPGWPNRKTGEQTITPLADISVGQFNSPHGVCADAQGNIYVSEWLLGDRFTKLERVSA